ncbi:MAG: acetyl-CoA C-acyltransferase [Planctomycetes bacterium]|nr:acetyl-CoA C-acyltransferase [Planctomycetota bacterium]
MTTHDAFIVSAVRTPVGKAHRGAFASTRPDDLLAHCIKGAVAKCPGLDPELIGDVIVGCAMPEGAQGMNVARIALLLAGLPESVPGVTVNRFCASGLQAVAWAADRIRLGEADVMIAAGAESMSMVPMMGYRPELNPTIFDDENIGIAYGMGITAEKVAQKYDVSREDQDAWALESHRRACVAQAGNEFADEILPVPVIRRRPSADAESVDVATISVKADEGPRQDTSMEALARLRPVFARKGSVTAGNASQTSDGAAAIVLMSGSMMEALALTPLARFCSFAVAGVPPEIMGIGPIAAIPTACARAGISQNQLDHIELNEAFAAQTLAVIRDLDLDPQRTNPLGSAIALGHPLGATGAIRTATVVHALNRRNQRYGMITMCIGTGMGAAGILERVG